MSKKKKQPTVDDAYNVFHKVDELVSKPISGSHQALQWQTFRSSSSQTTTTHNNATSVAPKAPLKKSDRAAGFASWEEERKHEATLRRDRGDAALDQGYSTFSTLSHAEIQQAALTRKQETQIRKKIRPEDKDYFMASPTFRGWKHDYVFTTRDRGTGYYWDGSDSVKKLDGTLMHVIENKTQGQTNTQDSTISDTPSEPEKKKRKKKEPPVVVVVHDPKNPIEQVAALVQARQAQESLLPPGWEQAFDSTTQKLFYFNRASGQRTWEPPVVVIADEWKTTTDPSTGKAYYYNASGETRWEDPR
jgi:hypothetical protein